MRGWKPALHLLCGARAGRGALRVGRLALAPVGQSLLTVKVYLPVDELTITTHRNPRPAPKALGQDRAMLEELEAARDIVEKGTTASRASDSTQHIDLGPSVSKATSSADV